MTEHFDLRIEPSDHEVVCDFCLSPDVKWSFPCRDFETETDVGIFGQHPDGRLAVRRERITDHSSGDWAACPACHALIMRGDREQLAVRSSRKAFKRHPDLAEVFNFKNYVAHVRTRQDAFWANRQGRPLPVGHPLTVRERDP